MFLESLTRRWICELRMPGRFSKITNRRSRTFGLEDAVRRTPAWRKSTLMNANSDTAIADGALLRFFNQNRGPGEIMRQNYGFPQNEVYDAGAHDGHKNAEPVRDPVDGEMYVENCIKYFVRKVRDPLRVHDYKTLNLNIIGG
jgi:hypothetical protein